MCQGTLQDGALVLLKQLGEISYPLRDLEPGVVPSGTGPEFNDDILATVGALKTSYLTLVIGNVKVEWHIFSFQCADFRELLGDMQC